MALGSVRDAGAIPLIETRHTRVTRELLCGMTEEQATIMRDIKMARTKKVQSYIAIRGAANTMKPGCPVIEVPLFQSDASSAQPSGEQNQVVCSQVAHTEYGPLPT